MRIVHFSVGSEPTAIDKIPCGDRDARGVPFRGFGTHGYSQDPLRGSGCAACLFRGSEPTAIDKIPCGDRDGASHHFRGFGTSSLLTRSLVGSGWAPYHFRGSEPHGFD